MSYDPKGATCSLCESLVAVKKHGWCWGHYLRFKRHGHPEGGKKMRRPGAPIEHGVYAGYIGGCRCPMCNGAQSRYHAERSARFARGELRLQHGIWSTYCTGCRCLLCRNASRNRAEHYRRFRSLFAAADRERERLRQIRVAASNARERARQTREWLETAADAFEREQMELLLAQQTADAGRDRFQFEPSLDAPVGDGDSDARRTYGVAVHFDRDDDAWPFYAERSRTRRLRVNA